MINLEKDIKWFEQVLKHRIQGHLLNKEGVFPKDPTIDEADNYGSIVLENNLQSKDRLVFIATLLPHILPSLFDKIIQEEIPQAGDLPEIGGVRGSQFRGFLPTGETLLFLLGSKSLTDKLKGKKWLETESVLWGKSMVRLSPSVAEDPRFSGIISIDIDVLDRVVSGKVSDPEFGIDFPARAINTKLSWNDLILDKRTKHELQELKSWMEHQNQILKTWGLEKRLKSGYRALFFGSSGTGKTLAAALLGKHLNTKVYRVDLSMVVSKYIGETEKNLSRLFDKAMHKNWILFFDEADSLFGKRTGVRDAHDKYANQEVSYLLQKVEEYEGLVILASNLKGNIDEAFLRRFQSVIYFPVPNHKERLKLWQNLWPTNMLHLHESEEEKLASQFELTGANILNVIQYACIKAAEKKEEIISVKDIYGGVRRELKKEGKMV